MTHENGLIPPPDALRPTRVRYLVLGVLCSLAFLTYLDRICISQVQDDIANSLHFSHLTSQDQSRLDQGAGDNYQTILIEKDLQKLEAHGQLSDAAARRQAALERLQDARSKDRRSW